MAEVFQVAILSLTGGEVGKMLALGPRESTYVRRGTDRLYKDFVGVLIRMTAFVVSERR